ncbi:O-antigen ligase family protein [bacterium]
MAKIKEYLFVFLFFFPSLFFLPNVMRNAFYVQTVIVYAVLSLLVSIFIIELMKKSKIVFYKISLVEILLFLYWFICVVSWVSAMIRFPQYSTALFSEGSRAVLLLTFNSVIVFYVTIFFIKDNRILKKVLTALFLSAVIASIYAILQFFGIELIWPQKMSAHASRPISTFGNPNFLASCLMLLLPLTIHRIIYSKIKIQWYIASILMLTALICTSTRSAWLGLVCGLIVFFLFYIKTRKRNIKKVSIISFLTLLVISAVVYVSPARNEVKERIQLSFVFKAANQAVHQRLLVWTIAKDMFLEHPLLGFGWGSFEIFYSLRQGDYLKDKRFRHYTPHANNAHNEILEQLTQTGIIGFGVFVLLLFVLWKTLSKALYLKNIDDSKRMELAAITAGICAMLVDNMLNVTLHFTIPMMVFWFLAGIGVNKVRWITKDTESIEYNIKFPVKIITGLVIIFLVWINIVHIRYFYAEKYHFKGLALQKGPNTLYNNTRARKHLQKAASLNKYHVKNYFALGNTLMKLNLTDEAIKSFKRGITVHPGFYEIYVNLGRAYLKKGDKQNAVEQFRIARQLSPLLTDDVPKL